MKYKNHAVEELQTLGALGDTEALIELGKRVLDFDFCLGTNHYCEHFVELDKLNKSLASELPDRCPNCDELLSDL